MAIIKEKLLERLESAVEKIENSKDYHIRKINKMIARYIEDLEDLAIAEERSADIHSGKSKTIPHEEVMRENGLL